MNTGGIVENNLIPSSCAVEIDQASTSSIDIFEPTNHQSTFKLLIRSDSGSNFYLCTSTDILHNWTDCVGNVNVTGGGKAKVTARGELHALFKIDDVHYWIIIERFYVMPSNKHHTLGLAPFKKSGCTKAIHIMYEHVEFHFDNATKSTMPITLISNSLDYVSLEIMPPTSCYSSNNNNKEDGLIP